MPTVEANGDDRAVELYRRYRPRQFKDVLGHGQVITQLEEMFKRGTVPHLLLFSGPSGTGKTTLARIVARKLGCHRMDCKEVNAAESRGIDMVRQVSSTMGLSPMAGKVRVWVLDEAHRLTGEAQDALLKTLEDTPTHCYFILCTTNPQKVIATIRNRATTIALNPVPDKLLAQLVKATVLAEGKQLGDAVVAKIVDAAQGSPRKALVDLHRVLHLPGESEQLAAVADPALEKGADDLVRLLFWQGGAKPPSKRQVLDLIAQLPDTDDWEGFRRRCLATAATVLLHKKGDPARAAAVLGAFRVNWFDDAGKSGVVAASLQALTD